ncbi:XrtY-associated glycosyltransferase XYAG1 [Pedobacter rhodius]|uniref:Glycosyltransferase n=1 Tax=Pedobacter rhodius TaxID=3004098 RepID=A0ABT4KVA9_9SPHI|nr:glycosyltransferase [Pedobacter sp. SJ11]MCZ4221788.1 glycosyltransferase [Pedobacter sp. SJ11]
MTIREKMKILHITPSYKPAYIYGGPIQSVAKLCEAFIRTDEQEIRNKAITHLEVLTTTANGKHELRIEAGEKHIIDGVFVTYFSRLTKDHSHFSPGLLWTLRREIINSLKLKAERSKPDKLNSNFNQGRVTKKKEQQLTNNELIIHIHAWWNLVSVLSCWLAKFYKVPVVLSPRGMLTDYTQNNRNSLSKKILHNLIGKKLLQYCHIHATTEQEQEDILKIVQPISITVIPNLINIGHQVAGGKYQVASSEYQVASSEYQDASRKYQGDNETFKMIFLSRIEEKKGLDLLFDALPLLDFPWSLTLAGSGAKAYVETLKRKAENLKLNHNIKWLGQISNEEKFDLLASHDLSVLISYNENFANVVVESLSVGTAVLLSNKVGLSAYVAEKNLGWITSLNIEDISQQLKSIERDKMKLNLINTIAPQIIRADFDDNVLVSKYTELYKRVIGKYAENISPPANIVKLRKK